MSEYTVTDKEILQRTHGIVGMVDQMTMWILKKQGAPIDEGYKPCEGYKWDTVADPVYSTNGKVLSYRALSKGKWRSVTADGAGAEFAFVVHQFYDDLPIIGLPHGVVVQVVEGFQVLVYLPEGFVELVLHEIHRPHGVDLSRYRQFLRLVPR